MHWWTRSGLCSSGIGAVLGHRSRATPGSAKARHKGQWLGCPKPLLQPRPQVLDLPHPTSADSHCPKPPGCGQLPFFSAGKPVSGEHEQSGKRTCDNKRQRPNLRAVRVRYESQRNRKQRTPVLASGVCIRSQLFTGAQSMNSSRCTGLM